MKKLLFFIFIFSAFVLNKGFAQTGRPLFTHPIGIPAYMYRTNFSDSLVVVATLDTIKALGITEMEGPEPLYLSPGEFKKLIDERNISMPSVGVDYKSLMKNPEEIVRQAIFFNAKYITVSWIPHGKTFTIEDVKKAAEDFNRVGKVLQENGITLCYHNHGYEFEPYEDGTLFDYIIKNTNPKYVSFEMDVLWTFHGGVDPAKLLYKYHGRWKLMRLKDIRKDVPNDYTDGIDNKNEAAFDIKNDVALGTGQLNIPEILKAANAVGIKHYFIEDESGDHATQIPVTIAYLKSLKE